MKCKIPLLVVVAVATLLACAAPARAVDGVPLYPPGAGHTYDSMSMRLADMSGPMVGVEMQPIPVVVGPFLSRVYGWNAAVGSNFPLTPIGGTPATVDQRGVTVLDVGAIVTYAWMQQDDPATTDWDVWLWKGDDTGVAFAGYPRRVVSGPKPSNQILPDLGIVREGTGDHVVLAWLDDRASAPTAPQVYMLDLSKDSNANGTPDFEEPAFDPATAGTRVDPGGGSKLGQWGPVVGAKGIFWIDDRHAIVHGSTKYGREVWRASLVAGSHPGLFWSRKHLPAGSVNGLRATKAGAAWLASNLFYQGSGWMPLARRVGGNIRAVSFSGDGFAVSGGAYALTDTHGGFPDGDSDIFFKGATSGQVVPVCTVGGVYDESQPTVEQIEPAIATAPGGYRVVWSDSRQIANTPTTPQGQLAYQLYVALVPTVALRANIRTVLHGHAVTFSCSVSPNFSGAMVRLQRGRRTAKATPFGPAVIYHDWSVRGIRALSATSRATFTWTPQAKGTYYLRVRFAGGKRYTDVGSRKVPHVPNVSRVIRIVVK